MIGGDQSHLFGEWKIEKEDTTVRAKASLIINVAIRANVPPGMPPVYLLELLIHRPQAGTKKQSILATKRHKRHKKYLISNAESVRKPQPKVGALATTLGSHQEGRIQPCMGSPQRETLTGFYAAIKFTPRVVAALQP